MESFVLDWPEEEKWRITHSSVEGDGRTVAFELRQENPPKEGERIWQLVWLSPEDLEVSVLLEQWIREFHKTQASMTWQEIEFSLPYPAKVFSMEHLSFDGKVFSALGFMARGEEVVLLHLHLTPESIFPDPQPYLNFFQSLQFKPQSLRASFEEGGLMPSMELTIQEKDPSPQAHLLPEKLRPYAHPDGLKDIPYWQLSEDGGKVDLFWARFLRQKGENLFIAMELGTEERRSIFLQWDEGRRAFVAISTAGLAMQGEWEISPCKGCKFEMLDPSIVAVDQLRRGVLNCPFCKNEIVITKRIVKY